MTRPSDMHCGWIRCQLECRGVEVVVGGLRDRINYHLQQIITGEGVWKCNLRSMCALAPLDFTLTGSRAGWLQTHKILELNSWGGLR